VVSGASSITVTLNGSTQGLPATIVGADPAHDLALLKISGVSSLPVLSFGDSSKIVAGDGVIAVGYALGLTGGPTVTAGIVSATGRQVSTQTSTGASQTLTGMLQTDAAISSGNTTVITRSVAAPGLSDHGAIRWCSAQGANRAANRASSATGSRFSW
jgi:Trypsin-like serine proteases, typically periplasmic, contain C-terminal PDZ domain